MSRCLVIADDLREEPLDEFLQEARELHRNLPIFVITDPDDVAEAVSAMRHGATAVIEIPPSYAALREEVARASSSASQRVHVRHIASSAPSNCARNCRIRSVLTGLVARRRLVRQNKRTSTSRGALHVCTACHRRSARSRNRPRAD